MKKLILGLAFAGSLLVNAQEKTTFGVKAGLNGSMLSDPDGYETNQKLKAGFNAGIFVNIPVAEKFSIQPELLYNQVGSKTEQRDKFYINDDIFRQEANYKTTLSYISLPVMVQYNILPQLYVEAGPEFGLLLEGKQKGDVTLSQTSGSFTSSNTQSFSNKTPRDLLKTFSFGIGIGGGYYFTQNLAATARFTAGLTDVNKIFSGVKSTAFQIGLAYQFK